MFLSNFYNIFFYFFFAHIPELQFKMHEFLFYLLPLYLALFSIFLQQIFINKKHVY